MRLITVGLVTIVLTSTLVVGAVAAYKEGYLGGGFDITVKSYWDGETIDGDVLNNSSRKVRCLKAEFELLDENNRSLKRVVFEDAISIAAGASVGFTVNALAEGATTMRQSNTEFC